MLVTLLDDREHLETEIPKVDHLVLGKQPAETLSAQSWPEGAAFVLVSRNFEVDREALAVALRAESATAGQHSDHAPSVWRGSAAEAW